MVEERIIQTFSILFIGSGSIIAIKGLWERGLDKTIQKTEALIKAYDEALKKLETLVEEHTKNILKKHPNLGKKYKKLLKNYGRFMNFILFQNVFTYVFWFRAKLHTYYLTLIFFRKYLVPIGVFLIILGTILQLHIIWN